VQWLTAGRGIVHAEMFPLLATDQANPLELCQIWLNLPAASKMAPPHFTMIWSQDVLRHVSQDEAGRSSELAVIAGRLQDADAPQSPPPDSGPHSLRPMWRSGPSAWTRAPAGRCPQLRAN
jgi:redox-sensitive bicupin YhaK (pirin superfamily)